MQQAQKAKTYRPVVQLYDTLEQWLDSLELSQYLPHFTFFDINSDDVQNLYVMNTLNEKRFKEVCRTDHVIFYITVITYDILMYFCLFLIKTNKKLCKLHSHV